MQTFRRPGMTPATPGNERHGKSGMERRREIIGIALVVFNSVCFALANTLAMFAYGGGSDPLSVSTARFFLPALFLVIFLLAPGRKLVLRQEARGVGNECVDTCRYRGWPVP